MNREGGEGALARRRGCLPAILARVLGVVTVEVVVDVPAPASRRTGTVALLAGAVVVAVVTGRVLLDVTGTGWLVVVGTVVVLADVTGRVWMAVVTGCVVVAAAVPTPATGGRLNRFNAPGTRCSNPQSLAPIGLNQVVCPVRLPGP